VLERFPLGIVASNVALLGVVGLDILEEASARRRAQRWVAIASVHRTYALDPLLDRLAAAKIDAIARAVRTRAFFQFFAPWAPIEVIVPENEVARAREVVEQPFISASSVSRPSTAHGDA